MQQMSQKISFGRNSSIGGNYGTDSELMENIVNIDKLREIQLQRIEKHQRFNSSFNNQVAALAVHENEIINGKCIC